MRISVLIVLAGLSLNAAARAQNANVNLDDVAQKVITRERVAGASVLVARDGKVILHKGYGFADLGLDAPAKDETVYHVVGPMLPFTGIAVLQLVERGKLSLDDDISKYIPEFPMQGHRVSIRQLLNHTSGIVDYHYLGDPIEATSRQPKALDEVMALYAGKNWVNEPGKKWDWSISGFQLLVTIVERVSGQRFPEYAQQNIFTPSGVKSTTYCDDFNLTRGLAHAYRKFGNSYVPANENGMAYNSDLRFCSTVGDLYQLWRAIQEKNLVRPETFKLMTTAEGAAVHMSAQDPKAQYGFAMILNHEEEHRRIGQHGSLLGYSGSLYDFPDDHLTIIVLTNTEDQKAGAQPVAVASYSWWQRRFGGGRRKRLDCRPDAAFRHSQHRRVITSSPVHHAQRIPSAVHARTSAILVCRLGNCRLWVFRGAERPVLLPDVVPVDLGGTAAATGSDD